jgi:threonine/homoserine efflux transporter RhtA
MDIPVARWLKGVLLRCILTLTIPACFVAYIATSFDATLWRTASSFAACGMALAACTWIFGFNDEEKEFLRIKVMSLKKKVFPR